MVEQNLPTSAVRLSAVRRLFPIVALGTVLWFSCFSGLGSTPLIDLADEGLYASVSRQMVDTGEWLTPQSGTKLVFDKAPLNYWLQAASIRILGPTPVAARLPSAIAAALTALALWWWGWRHGRKRAGWLAAMIYTLCPLTMLGLARLAMMDSVLTLWLILALIGWIEAYSGSRNWYLLFAACAALAVMTKGELGLLLPCAAFLIWLAIRREWSELLRFPWITSALLFLAIVLPWHIAMWRVHGELFVQEYLVHHQVLRFLGRDFGHNAPVWYYLPVLLIGLFPWSAFAGYAWWRSLRYGLSAKKSSFDCAEAMWAVWAGVLVLFFSLSRSKLPNYVLPALPALSLLAAIRLDTLWREKGTLKVFETATIALGGLIVGTIFVLVGILGWQWKAQPSELPRPARLLGNLMGLKWEAQTSAGLWRRLTVVTELSTEWLMLGLLLIGGTILVFVYRREVRKVAAVTIAMNAAVAILAAHFALPAWGSYNAEALNKLALQTLPALERGEKLVLFGFHPPRTSLRYILGHNDQIIETTDPRVLQLALGEAGEILVLSEATTSLPPLEESLRKELIEDRWVLWGKNGR